MRTRPTVRRDVFRMCKRFAHRRRTDDVVMAARRLIMRETTSEAQWVADVRLLCEVNLGLNAACGYGGSGHLWDVAKRTLTALDTEGAHGVIARMEREDAQSKVVRHSLDSHELEETNEDCRRATI